MANGTIAFDTLTTSDSVNTGTEKSIDTSYIYNGVSKAWGQFDGDITTPVLESSFNTTTITDLGTGRFQTTITNAMNDALYPVHATVGNEQDDYSAQADGNDHGAFIGSRTTTLQRLFCFDHDDGTQDNPQSYNFSIIGDLA